MSKTIIIFISNLPSIIDDVQLFIFVAAYIFLVVVIIISVILYKFLLSVLP